MLKVKILGICFKRKVTIQRKLQKSKALRLIFTVFRLCFFFFFLTKELIIIIQNLKKLVSTLFLSNITHWLIELNISQNSPSKPFCLKQTTTEESALIQPTILSIPVSETCSCFLSVFIYNLKHVCDNFPPNLVGGL